MTGCTECGGTVRVFCRSKQYIYPKCLTCGECYIVKIATEGSENEPRQSDTAREGKA